MDFMTELSLQQTKSHEATEEKITNRMDNIEGTQTDLVRIMETQEN